MVIKFNQEAWLKPHKDMNTEMTTKATKDFLQAKIVRVQKDYGECEKVERHQAGNN